MYPYMKNESKALLTKINVENIVLEKALPISKIFYMTFKQFTHALYTVMIMRLMNYVP